MWSYGNLKAQKQLKYISLFRTLRQALPAILLNPYSVNSFNCILFKYTVEVVSILVIGELYHQKTPTRKELIKESVYIKVSFAGRNIDFIFLLWGQSQNKPHVSGKKLQTLFTSMFSIFIRVPFFLFQL